MKIRKAHRKTLLASAAFGALSLTGTMAWAQEDDATTDEDVVEVIEEEDDEARQERVVVTGSRIARDSFTSTAPLQVITAESIQDAGLVDLGEVLQSTSVVTGAQLDQTVTTSGFLGDGGPGGSAVGLRGLDPERTLTLVNGRRLAPAGVEGAPSFPDTSLIPTSIIERIDILLDGASSVYGSDAVAGVVNVVLRDEYDGFNIGVSRSDPIETGGEQTSFNAIMGATGDRGSFMLAGEYLINEPLKSNQRDWMASTEDGIYCDRAIETDANGQVLQQCNPSQAGIGILEQTFILYYGIQGITADQSEFGIPGFVDGRGDQAISPNGYGRWRDYLSLGQQEFDVTPQFERTSIYLTAKRDIDLFGGMELFTEFLFSNRQTTANNGPGQFTVPVPAENPFNPFGNDGASPIVGIFGGQDASSLLLTPWDNIIEVELDQYRLLGGARGDFTLNEKPWNYEVFSGYTRSQGFSQRTGVNEINLALSTYTTEIGPDGNPRCNLSLIADRPETFGGFFGIDPEPCVPINFFAPSLFGPNPSFAEGEAAVNYLRDVRTVSTFVDEAIVGGYATGPIMELPAGDVKAVLGFEWRDDAIDTKSDSVAQRATLDGFFFDRPTKGSVYIGEVYGELFIPLLKDQPFAYNAELELAGRLIEHEFYGNDSVYSIKGSYSPTDFLTVKGTYGTSFRAPNLRELFLEGQSSFQVAIDPCEVPAVATVPNPTPGGPPVYDPTLDDRDPQILANCRAEGLDPTTLGLAGGATAFQAVNAGNTGLEPEESTAWSIGVTFEQPFTDAFDLSLGVTKFDLDIENTVFTPTLNTVLGICYTSDNFPNDIFCSRRTRDPNTGFLTEVDATPFNVSSRVSSGIDYNARYSQEFAAFGQEMNLEVDLQATQSEEISLLIDIPGQEPDFDDFVGDIGSPEWRGRSQISLDVADLRFSLISNYIGEQEDLTPPGSVIADGVATVATVDDYWRHTLSARYAGDDYAIQVAIQNLLDEDPPLVDQDVTGFVSARNVPLGVGYDQRGRSIFVSVSKSF